ncbi:kinase-like domain-containing protein [Rhizophagus clarus]|uniref:Kinase-like domain-containing protein n=1 Tax=Rhizophagus clarus TaxID=94130 RepID=A0A8H3QP21_9GLOM|nr:kinase-like domain-containing protein [Rhizophagus clarus]
MFFQYEYLTTYNILEYLSENLKTWTSKNEKIDYFIQRRQLNHYCTSDVIIEWIPYNQFIEIKEISKSDSYITLYSAIWKDGPLKHNCSDGYIRSSNKKITLKYLHNSEDPIDSLINKAKKYSRKWDAFLVFDGYIRSSNKKITLKYLHNSEDPIDSLINEAKKYSKEWDALSVLYGISQNPDTNDYILIQNDYISMIGNERIDNFIQEIQLNDKYFIYSAIWKDGPLKHNCRLKNIQENGMHFLGKYIRSSNKKITLKYLYNSEDPIDSLINEAKKYSRNWNAPFVFDGYIRSSNKKITLKYLHNSEDPIDSLTNEAKKYSRNWNAPFVFDGYIRSSNKKITLKYLHNSEDPIDSLINEAKKYLKEWDALLVFSNTKVTLKYLHNLEDPIDSLINEAKKYSRKWDAPFVLSSNTKVTLKYLHNLEDPIDSLINEAKKYSRNWNAPFVLYGISQNPDTNDYILVQNNYILTSGNERIDNFIQEMQLEIIEEKIVIEWIPYDHFIEIEEISKSDSYITYSAIWKHGPLKHNYSDGYIRCSNKKIILKHLHNSEDSIDFVINEAKKYPRKQDALLVLYGISQNPDTNDYILVQNDYTLTSGNERIDNFIQEIQSKINENVYSAIWKDGLLRYDYSDGYIRSSNTKVALKYLHNLGDPIDSLINEVKKYSVIKDSKIISIYGISQNPDTNDYILVQNSYILLSENGSVDNVIQEMQLKINGYNDIIFEWIPYSQFNNIKKIGEGGFSTIYLAKWKDGPLEYVTGKKIYERNKPNKIIALKCLHKSQNITIKFLKEAKNYSIIKESKIINIYGISQNPETEDYILVLNYAKDGSFNDWMNENYMYFNWQNKLYTLLNIIYGLKEIHEKNIVHRDFHTGNILFFNSIEYLIDYLSISDMGLCGEVGNVDETKIYGVMPYVAPEVLRGKPYTKAADIYSFGMIMYFVATGKQPFNNCAHDKLLALDICGGKRPDIHEPEAPRCYINLMKKCWNSNPIIRPNITELDELISSFYNSFLDDFVLEDDIGIQFKEAEEYRKANLLSFKNNQAVSHPQAIYTSRLLNPFTEGLSECNVDYNVDYYKSHPYTEDISQYNEDYESHPYAEAISQNNKDYESHPYTEDISQYNEDYESQCLDLQI